MPSIAAGAVGDLRRGQRPTADGFKTSWFPAPDASQVGTYSGGGIGLSTDGDAVNLFDAGARRSPASTFGASTTFFTFDNAAGLSGPITRLSVGRRQRRVHDGGETGSPGAIARASVSRRGARDRRRAGAALAHARRAGGVRAVRGRRGARLPRPRRPRRSPRRRGDAALSVADQRRAPGRLVNGDVPLAQPLQVRANAGAYAPVSASPATLLTYAGAGVATMS